MQGKHLRKMLAAFLAATMTLGALAACNPDPRDPDETEGETQTSDVTDDLTIETNQDTEPDITADNLMLAENGKTSYTLIIPDYAAVWELEAAEALQKLFSDAGVALPVAVDTETEAGEHEILLGYTNRTGEEIISADAYGTGPQGDAVFYMRASEGKLYIAANTADTMSAAIEQLTSDLAIADGAIGIRKDYECKASATGVGTDSTVLDGTYGETVKYAQAIKDGVQAGYADGSRTDFTMSSLSMAVTADLASKGNKLISSLVNVNGIPYLRDTMDIYAMTDDGSTFYASDSSTNGRINIYRYGTYYYETHILDANFGQNYAVDEASEPFSLLGKIGRLSGNQIENITSGGDGISYTVTNNHDPYLNLFSGRNYDTSKYNAVLITMRTEEATSAQFLLAAGSHGGIDGSQVVGFNVYPGDEFVTYLVRLDSAPDYTGKLNSMRMDCGAAIGEQVEISELKLVYVTETSVPSIAIDRTLHTYSDKLNQAVNLVMTGTVDNLTHYGMKTEIDATRVNSLIIVDKRGEHRDTLDNIDWASVTCVGFDIDRAGVFGYIMTTHEGSGTLTVTLDEATGTYIVDQRVEAKDSYNAEQKISFGHRVYTDGTHAFEGLLDAWKEEQYPLENVTITTSEDGAKYLGYDPLRGAYGFHINGTGFSEAYYQMPDKHFTINAQVEGDDNDRTIYVYGHSDYGNLESAVVLDENQSLLPIAVEVCKNFKGENEEPVYDKGDMSYGEAYFPLVVKAGETLNFSILHLYQNWGKYPLKQVSSIQFIVPYYHLSTGATETNCIAPYFVYGKDRWTLPDFRAMSAPLWESQPQHTSAGRLYFLEYTTSDGEAVYSESTVDTVEAYGPVYADVLMSYISDDGRIQVDYRHLEMPQTDENRTYYEIRMTVLEDIEINNFKDDFSIFSMDGRGVTYETVSYLDENGRPVIAEPQLSEGKADYHKLGMTSPFFAYSYTSESNDYVNMAVVIKDWDIVIGGEAYTDHLIFRDGGQGGLNEGTLTLDLEKVTLKAGDTIHINLILLPWGSQETEDGDISNVLQVRKDTCLDPFTAEVTVGESIADTYMAKIKAENNTAEFTVSGGHNNMVVRVYGFDGWEAPTIEKMVNGEWVTYDVASVNGYDGYMVFYDGDGTYSYAFVIPMDNGAPQTFRVSA